MEWPTPGLWPGLVGRKASTPFVVSIPWFKGLGLAAIFLGFVAIMPLVSGLKQFTQFNFFFGFKFLPSMLRISWPKMIIRKNKQVRIALAMIRERMDLIGVEDECASVMYRKVQFRREKWVVRTHELRRYLRS